MYRRGFLRLLLLSPALAPALLRAERRSLPYPLVGPYNFALRKNYPTVYRYLNVVDIGHGELAEVLLTNRRGEEYAVHRLEHVTFNRVSEMFLDPRRAPRLQPHEETVAPESVKVAWKLSQAFDWTHILHRQIYDILAADFSAAERERYVREAYNWYLSEPQHAFPGRLKTHDLMEHQWFSQYWREKYPRFKGAIWAYHWYQLRLNEVMLAPERAARDAAVEEATSEFRAMFENPELLPKHMPMAHTISPSFRARFAEIADCFDNLHMFHDIYNDILAHPQIPDKRAEVYKQLEAFLAPGEALETAPLAPLPAALSRQDHRRLNQLTHLEHMAMMLMPTAEQVDFFRQPTEARAQIVQKLLPEMARHWPNLEKKHPAGHEHQH
ncbi:MAG: hypothetical protein ACRD4D_09570 [Candidatus Acidiferrales bacterium]